MNNHETVFCDPAFTGSDNELALNMAVVRAPFRGNFTSRCWLSREHWSVSSPLSPFFLFSALFPISLSHSLSLSLSLSLFSSLSLFLYHTFTARRAPVTDAESYTRALYLIDTFARHLRSRGCLTIVTVFLYLPIVFHFKFNFIILSRDYFNISRHDESGRSITSRCLHEDMLRDETL